MARVFISHSSRDNDAAHRIKNWLQAQGFDTPFLDFDKHAGIPPGADWEKTLYREIEQAEAIVVIQTPNWLESKWCFAEFTQARALGKPIFPVIEAPTGETLISSDIQALDLRQDWEGGLEQLRRQLTQIALDAQGGFPWQAGRSPYPGLLAFQEEDAAIYFGRDDDIRRLIERLEARRAQGGTKLIALLGASGSGKSSLLRAGVIPRLKRARRNWLILPPMRPQARPLDELARALAVAAGADWRALREGLAGAAAAQTLGDIASDLRVKANANEAQILLPVDQAEELFGAADPDQSRRFQEVLSIALSSDLPYLAVMALRSDYLGPLQSAQALSARFEEFSLGPMPVARIAQVIEGPARVVGLAVDDDFVHQAVHDAQTEDALPLLAFALRDLYDRASGDGRLSLDEYQALGDAASGLTPLENAVRKAADKVLADARPGDEELAALRDAFVPAMVRVNDQGEYVRRPAAWDELPPKAHALLERLAIARLLVVRQEGNARIVEVAHEALLRKWPRLRSWLDDAREFLAGRQRMEAERHDWERAAEADKPAALLTGLKLNRARGWLAERPQQLSAAERAYVQASIQQAEALEARRLRRRRNTTRAATAAAVVLAVVAGAAVWEWQAALTATETAKRQEATAIAAKEEAVAQARAARQAKDEAVPWIIRATWRSGTDYKPQPGFVTGIRKLIEFADPIINLDKFRFLAPVPIFTGGPHGTKFDWGSSEFARYNPDFVEWAADHLIPGAEDAAFRAATQSVYDDHLSTLAQAYCISYQMLHKDPEVLAQMQAEYLDMVKAGTSSDFLGTPLLSNYFAAMDIRQHDLRQTGVFPYYSHVAAAFWIRREIDRTASLFIGAIRKLLDTYDPAFARACQAIDRPFSAAMLDAFPRTWRLGPSVYATFAPDGGLTIRHGRELTSHQWAFVGPGRLQVDGQEVSYDPVGMPISVSDLPTVGSDLRMDPLQVEQPSSGDDLSGQEVDALNATEVQTTLGTFARTGRGLWRGPGRAGSDTPYREMGRKPWAIYLLDERDGSELELWRDEEVRRSTASTTIRRDRGEPIGRTLAMTRP